MDFKKYQELANVVAIYPGRKEGIAGLCYTVLGLNGEAGEVAEKMKKLIRDKNGIIDDSFKEALIKECGDVLWYISQVCEELGIQLNDVAMTNIEKLFDRKDRGVLNGSGDNR